MLCYLGRNCPQAHNNAQWSLILWIDVVLGEKCCSKYLNQFLAIFTHWRWLRKCVRNPPVLVPSKAVQCNYGNPLLIFMVGNLNITGGLTIATILSSALPATANSRKTVSSLGSISLSSRVSRVTCPGLGIGHVISNVVLSIHPAPPSLTQPYLK